MKDILNDSESRMKKASPSLRLTTRLSARGAQTLPYSTRSAWTITARQHR